MILAALALAQAPRPVVMEIPRDEKVVSAARFECTVYPNDGKRFYKISTSIPSAPKWILSGSGVAVTVSGRGAQPTLVGPFQAKLLWDKSSERVYYLTRDIGGGKLLKIGLTLRNDTPSMANITVQSSDPKSEDYRLVGVANCTGRYSDLAEKGTNQ